jgi:hypothetical protein
MYLVHHIIPVIYKTEVITLNILNFTLKSQVSLRNSHFKMNVVRIPLSEITYNI